MGEDEYIAKCCSDLGDDAIRSGSYFSRCLAAWRAIHPEPPTGPHGMNFGRGQALILTVIPFHQVVSSRGSVCKASNAAGLERSSERACEYKLEVPSTQHRGEAFGSVRAAFSQLEICTAGEAADLAPIRLAVPNQDHLLNG